jgi:hypothetical protein
MDRFEAECDRGGGSVAVFAISISNHHLIKGHPVILTTSFSDVRMGRDDLKDVVHPSSSGRFNALTVRYSTTGRQGPDIKLR